MTKQQLLKQYFGYDTFREGQEQLMDAILAGRDAFGIMPTGAGKSLCFQIPALMLSGTALVISPLISLMKDQVEALNQAGIHAAYLNSSLTYGQYRKALSLAEQGRYKLIYVAPERLVTEEFLAFACNAEISMVAVDEAHCVSQWGQDFRPSYLKIVEFVERLPKRPVLAAFTATATREVREDVVRILKLRDPLTLTTGFDRPNLFFSVETPKNKYEAVKSFLEERSGKSGIIYCLTRKTVEEVCSSLLAEGVSATRYHAGLSDAERRKNQEDFIYDRAQIMVATNAFGMGIDKPDVRFVVHYNMPKNMESYYQEAGRAGRDGEPADCLLLYSGQDVITNQLFIEHNRDNEELDVRELQLVMERDRERLKRMTYYCFTGNCLRDYILRYFGEYGSGFCGNCGNCLGNFETADVTEEARALLGCVKDCGQRYGITVILDTVHGAKTAKIRQYGMEENPYYGLLAKTPTHRLRQILNVLLAEEYLRTTDDGYLILKLGQKGIEFLSEDGVLAVKLAKDKVREDKKQAKNERTKKKPKGSAAAASLSEQEEALFERLRALRRELAEAEKLPPYLVFSDKTLADMCRKRPSDREEMLAVTGVGAFKYEKYGERFLKELGRG